MARFGQSYSWPLPADATPTNSAYAVAGTVWGGGLLQRVSTEPVRVLNRITPGVDEAAMRRLAPITWATVDDRNRDIGSGPMEGLLAGHAVEPSEADGWYAGPPTDMASPADTVNMAVPMARRIAAPNMYEMPGEGEFLFLHKPFHGSQRISTKKGSGGRFGRLITEGIAREDDRWKIGGFYNNQFNPRLIGGNGYSEDYYAVDAYAYRGSSVTNLDKIFVEGCSWVLENDPEFYFNHLTPAMLMYGHPDLDWTGWMGDGFIRLEEAVDGPSTRISDSYGPTLANGPFSKGTLRGGRAEKNVSVVRAGLIKGVLDIWQSAGTTRGARIGLCITKRPLPKDGKVPYVMSSKSGTLEQNPPGVYCTVQTDPSFQKMGTPDRYRDTTDLKKDRYYAAMKEGFSPFRVVPIANPSGEAFDPSFKRYKDELGREHYDALIIDFGNILFEPFRMQPQPCIDSPDDPMFEPLTNGTRAMLRMPFPGVITQPFKEGYFRLL